jgi:hypothetical protein
LLVVQEYPHPEEAEAAVLKDGRNEKSRKELVISSATVPIRSRAGAALAARPVTMRAALLLLVAPYVVLIVGFFMLPAVALPILGYIGLNLAYSYFLKDQPVIDIFSVASSAALGVALSSWMAITTLCLALFLASIKRRTELASAGSGAAGRSRNIPSRWSIATPRCRRWARCTPTDVLLTDWPLIACILVWGGICVYVLMP